MGLGSVNPVKAVKRAAKSISKSISKGIKSAGRKLDAEIHRAGRDIDQELGLTEDLQHPLNEVKKIGLFKTPDFMKPPELPAMEKDTYIAPDYEELARARRRRSGGRGTPTIMSQGTESLGG